MLLNQTSNSRQHCWREYLHLCAQNSTIFFPKQYTALLRKSILDDISSNICDESPFLTAQHSPSASTAQSSTHPTLYRLPSCPARQPEENPLQEQPMSYAKALKTGLKGNIVDNNTRLIFVLQRHAPQQKDIIVKKNFHSESYLILMILMLVVQSQIMKKLTTKTYYQSYHKIIMTL